MPISGWMNKENMVYTYRGILFNLKKEGNSVLCYNMDELWGNYATSVFFFLTMYTGKLLWLISVLGVFFWVFFGHAMWLAGILVPQPGPRQWKCQVLTTGLPGNSHYLCTFNLFFSTPCSQGSQVTRLVRIVSKVRVNRYVNLIK